MPESQNPKMASESKSWLWILLAIGLLIYGVTKINDLQERITALEGHAEELEDENARLRSKGAELFDVAQHNSDLLQDIESQASGGQGEDYETAQDALSEIWFLASDYQEP